MDIKKFTETAKKQVEPKSIGMCARYVRQALESAGGVVRPRPLSAKYYGDVLLKNNFEIINEKIDNYKALNGDVILWFDNSLTKHGHIQIFVEGFGWVSDFKQNTIYPNFSKASIWLAGGYQIYRYKN